MRAIRHFAGWVAKKRHVSLDVPPRAGAGTASRAWGVQLLQSFPLVGPVVAGALWDHFDGLPLRWTCTAEELSAVRGIGPVRAGRLLDALGRPAVTAEGEVA